MTVQKTNNLTYVDLELFDYSKNIIKEPTNSIKFFCDSYTYWIQQVLLNILISYFVQNENSPFDFIKFKSIAHLVFSNFLNLNQMFYFYGDNSMNFPYSKLEVNSDESNNLLALIFHFRDNPTSVYVINFDKSILEKK